MLFVYQNWLARLIRGFIFKYTHREKAPSNKTPTLSEKYEYGHLGSLLHQIKSLHEVLKLK